MQRVGAILAVASSASEQTVTSGSALGERSLALLRRPVPLPADFVGEFQKYTRDMRLWERYVRSRQSDQLLAGLPVQVQDLWLADAALPSATGAITEQVADEPVSLAVDLQLVRGKNFTLTDRGRALRLAAAAQRDALVAGQRHPNPFALPLGAQVLVLWALLEADGEFASTSFQAAIKALGTSFTRASFSEQLGTVCRDLIKRWTRQARTGEDRASLTRLAELEREVSKPRASGENWGGGRPPDQAATVRLEPYVDLGVLSKVDRTVYKYQLHSAQEQFWGRLHEDGVDRFLDASLVSAWADARGLALATSTDAEAWSAIEEAYRELRRPLGYASVDEVLLLAIGQEAEKAGRYFEVGSGRDLVRRRYKENPRLIRFGVRRGGGLGYMKLMGIR